PKDSSGVAHILEHVVLAGSKRFPVRDPFFSMTRRSLATFMNAFTSADWTMYPFSSRNTKDFMNLLEVYLDATFFPRLSEDSFKQEGIRHEFEDPADPTSGLRYKGVVFNEMKGALASPQAAVQKVVGRALFP
ncbi:MAG: insulinase family protein, partial [Chloroflexi bacterium]